MTFDERRTACTKLSVYTDYECTSYQEACDGVIALCAKPDYISDDFQQALDKELLLMLDNYKENTKIEEMTEEVSPRMYKVLIWN